MAALMIALPLAFWMAFSIAMLLAVLLSYGLSVAALWDYALDLAELRRPSCRARLGELGWRRSHLQTRGYIALELVQMAVVAAFLVVGELGENKTPGDVPWANIVQNLVLFLAVVGQALSTAIRRYIRQRAPVRISKRR